MKNFAVSAMILATTIALGVAAPAYAGTYRLPIEGGDEILRVYVDHGKIKRVGNEGKAIIFEVTMDGNACSREVRLTYTNNAPTLVVPYDVCSQEGFGITMRLVHN